mmetsp:Transcript_34488/g.99294  ORF Transcript_34488/g.99294 Transcript_34488/m.99294 type:complete len:601 (+) Transcript_34488:219-2021(+)
MTSDRHFKVFQLPARHGGAPYAPFRMHQAASIDIPTADGGFSPNPLFRQLASSRVKFLPDGPSSAVEYAHNAALPGTLSQQQVVKLQQLREETGRHLDASSRHEVEECMDALGVPKEARDFAEIYGVLDAMDKAAVMHAARVPPEKDLWDFLHQHTGPGQRIEDLYDKLKQRLGLYYSSDDNGPNILISIQACSFPFTFQYSCLHSGREDAPGESFVARLCGWLGNQLRQVVRRELTSPFSPEPADPSPTGPSASAADSEPTGWVNAVSEDDEDDKTKLFVLSLTRIDCTGMQQRTNFDPQGRAYSMAPDHQFIAKLMEKVKRVNGQWESFVEDQRAREYLRQLEPIASVHDPQHHSCLRELVRHDLGMDGPDQASDHWSSALYSLSFLTGKPLWRDGSALVKWNIDVDLLHLYLIHVYRKSEREGTIGQTIKVVPDEGERCWFGGQGAAALVGRGLVVRRIARLPEELTIPETIVSALEAEKQSFEAVRLCTDGGPEKVAAYVEMLRQYFSIAVMPKKTDPPEPDIETLIRDQSMREAAKTILFELINPDPQYRLKRGATRVREWLVQLLETALLPASLRPDHPAFIRVTIPSMPEASG